MKKNKKNKPESMSFAIKELNSIYFDANMICISFDTYQSKDNHLEIDMYQFLSMIDTSLILDIKSKLTNYINEK